MAKYCESRAVLGETSEITTTRIKELCSYGNLVSAVDDPLIMVKLTFFSFISKIFEPFLKKYQNDKAMLPFMYGDLKNLVKSVLKIIIKPRQLEKFKNGAELKKLSLDDQTLHLPLKNMEMGYGVANIISNLREEDIVSNQQVKLFKEEAQSLLIFVLKKLFKITSLTSVVLRCSSIFDPVMLTGTSSTLLKRLKSLLVHWKECKILSPTKCDDVSNQFSKLLEQDLKKYHLEFVKFDQKCDQFEQYESLSFVLTLILTLSHGQAAVERCFSINNNVFIQNMNTEIVIVRKVIKGHMLSNKFDAATIEVDKSLVKAAGSA